MRTYEIVDGVVQNCIVIAPRHREAYARMTGVLLVDAEDSLNVEIGDLYDVETGIFSRDGVSLLVAQILAIRDRLLRESDYTQLLDFEASDEVRAAWAAYRQALREIETQEGFPDYVIWPEKPDGGQGGPSVNELLGTLLGA